MSLENDIKRIADALEKLAVINIPGIAPYTASASTAAQNTVRLEPVDPEIKTVAELKGLAQTIAAGLPENGIGAFTDYVRQDICARCGVKKLIEIPADRVAEAAKLLLAYKPKA